MASSHNGNLNWVLGVIVLLLIELFGVLCCAGFASLVTEEGWVQTLLKTKHLEGKWWNTFWLCILMFELALLTLLLVGYTLIKDRHR